MIVSAMPGTGKSHCAGKHPRRCADVDSSRFKNDDDSHDWDAYIWAIRAAALTYDIVLVSSHQDLRQHLGQEGLPFLYVAYRPDGLEDARERVLTRGTPQPNWMIASLFDAFWDEWMEMVDIGNPVEVHRLGLGQYVEDVLRDRFGIVPQENDLQRPASEVLG